MSPPIDELGSSTVSAESGQHITSWLQPVTGRQRFFAFALRVVPAVSLAGWLLFLRRPEDSQDSTLLWSFVIIACGLLLGVKASNVRELRVYEMNEVHFSKAQRLRRAAIWLVPSFGILTLTWLLQIKNNQFNQFWWYPWPLIFPILVGVGLYLLRSDSALSNAGHHAQKRDEAARLELASLDAKQMIQTPVFFDKFVASTPIRYTVATLRYAIAIAFLYGAYVSALQSSEKNSLEGALFCIVASFLFAPKVGGWLIGLTFAGGIVWSFYAGIAALPTSAAIVIGAIIIALALQK